MTLPQIWQIIEEIETRLPLSASERWDSTGLVCGNPKQKFRAALIGIDLTQALFAEALKRKANLIVIHHPPLFPKGRGISKLVLGDVANLQTLLLKCFQKNICVYVAHTNFDRCALGGMMKLADDLGSEPITRIWETPEPGQTLLKKLVTYVPSEKFNEVRDALFSVGCGHIGNYDSCGFGAAGIGSFRGLKGANPKIGKVGELEEVEEVRLETILVSGMERVAIDTLKEFHPYEEVAYDLYPVEQLPVKKGLVWGLGYGFVATLKKPVSYEVFAQRVKSVFKVERFLTNQYYPKKVAKIAFTPGKGASFVSAVQSHGVDVYVTGEVGYHASLDAMRSQLNVIELGHRESELYFLKTFEAWIKGWGLSAHILDERTQAIR